MTPKYKQHTSVVTRTVTSEPDIHPQRGQHTRNRGGKYSPTTKKLVLLLLALFVISLLAAFVATRSAHAAALNSVISQQENPSRLIKNISLWILSGILGLFFGSQFLSPLWARFNRGALIKAEEKYWKSDKLQKLAEVLGSIWWPLLFAAFWVSPYPNLTNHWLLALAFGHLAGLIWHRLYFK